MTGVVLRLALLALALLLGTPLAEAGRATAPQTKAQLSAYAKQRPRDARGRFTPMDPTRRMARGTTSGEGHSSTWAGSSPARFSLTAATSRRAGALVAEVDELQVGKLPGGSAQTRHVYVADLAGKVHAIPATLKLGANRRGWARATLRATIPAGVSISQAAVSRALKNALFIDNVAWQPAARGDGALRRLSP